MVVLLQFHGEGSRPGISAMPVQELRDAGLHGPVIVLEPAGRRKNEMGDRDIAALLHHEDILRGRLHPGKHGVEILHSLLHPFHHFRKQVHGSYRHPRF